MSIYGLVIIKVVNIVSILGINDNVILLICVVVCNRLIIKLLINVVSNNGVVNVRVIFIVLMLRVIIDLGVMIVYFSCKSFVLENLVIVVNY